MRGSSKTRTRCSAPSCRWGAVEHRGSDGGGCNCIARSCQASAGCKAEFLEVQAGRALYTPELPPPPLQWCEKHKRSGRQTLGDLLIKPHQRITKYPLLLQAVLKRSPEPRAQLALDNMVGI